MKVIREHCMISLHVVWFLFNYLLVWHNNVFKLSWQLFAANIDMWLTVINLMWLIAYNIRRTFSVYINILLNWFKSWMYYIETYVSCRHQAAGSGLKVGHYKVVLCWQVSAFDRNNQTRQYQVQSGCTRSTWQYSICLVPTCRYVDLMQSWKLRSQENLLVCFDVVPKTKSSITPSDRGRNGVHVAKIPWSLSAAPLGQGNRYRNDNDRLIVCQLQ